MKKLLIGLAAISLSVGTSFATTLTSKISMDNQFTVYISTGDSSAGTSFGTGTDWTTTYVDTTTLNAGTDYYLHVYGKDVGGIAGFLGEFLLNSTDHAFSNGTQKLLTNTANWKGNGTGFNGTYSSPLTDLGQDGVAPWGNRPNIDDTARWIWYGNANSNDDSYFTTKISASSVPDHGSTLALVVISFLGLASLRRKFKKQKRISPPSQITV